MGTVHALAIAPGTSGREAARRRVLMRETMRLRGSDVTHGVTVKDISSTGLSASTAVSWPRGARVEIDLPNIGPVPANVVRTQDGVIALQFGAIIDPDATQATVTGSYGSAPGASTTPLYRI